MSNIQQTTIAPDIVVVELSGRLILGRESQQLELSLEELIASQHKKVVLDMSKLEYLDSTGIGIVVTSCGRMDTAGGVIRIAALQPKVEELMRTMKLDRILPIYATVDEALRGFVPST